MERIKRSGLIDPARVLAVEIGACPHTAIREDPTLNIEAVEKLAETFPELEVVLVESGGDNLASRFSLELVDYWLFVINTAAGDDIPRKRGLGINRSDLLVINKTDLAPSVGKVSGAFAAQGTLVIAGRSLLVAGIADELRTIGLDYAGGGDRGVAIAEIGGDAGAGAGRGRRRAEAGDASCLERCAPVLKGSSPAERRK
jgi:hypothetical protein